jgi:mRNA-degrading endonuclease RelE of RelBE toxin-antitoxin system
VSYRIALLPEAQRDLANLPPRERERIRDRIDALVDNPQPHPQSRALSGTLRGMRRLRVGGLRVGYTVNEDAGTVTICGIGPRGGIYQMLTRRFR